jgi:hypothetical protein
VPRGPGTRQQTVLQPSWSLLVLLFVAEALTYCQEFLPSLGCILLTRALVFFIIYVYRG